jgi:hypothetical protein
MWRPGQSGNPAGRPVGVRHRLQGAFIGDVLTVWEKKGQKVLEKLADDNPVRFLEVVGVVANINEQRTNHPAADTRPVFDLGSVLANIAAGGAAAGLPRPLLERPVLPAEICAEPTGCPEAVDSGPLPRGAE